MTTEMDALARQLAHCDGVDCTCAAWGACECGCDADWTPAEVYKLRARVRELERENGELRSVCDEAELNREGIKIAHKELAAITRRIAEAPKTTAYADGDDGLTIGCGPHILACMDESEIGECFAIVKLEDGE